MKSSDLSYSQYLFGFLQYTDVHYLPDLNFLSLLLVDNAGDDELSFNCFFGDQTAPIANAVDHSVLTPYTLTDPSKGVWMLSVTASDINDWPLGYLKYSIVGDRASGDQVMLYTDRQYGPYSNLKVLEGPYPMPPEAIIIEQSDMINSAVFQSNATSIVSSAYPGSAAVGNISAVFGDNSTNFSTHISPL